MAFNTCLLLESRRGVGHAYLTVINVVVPVANVHSLESSVVTNSGVRASMFVSVVLFFYFTCALFSLYV